MVVSVLRLQYNLIRGRNINRSKDKFRKGAISGMNGKNIIAGLIISIVSVALAIGITYMITSNGKSAGLSFETAVPLQFTPPATPTNDAVVQGFTPTINPSNNCTFPLETWLQYPSAWQINSYRLGSKTYNKTEMLAILQKGGVDPWARLQSQIFVVVLNQENGADVTGIRNMFSQAVTWLISFPTGSQPSGGDLQTAQITYETLQRYTQGELGIPRCQYVLSDAKPATLLPTSSSSLTSTITPQIWIYFTLSPMPTEKPNEPKKKPASPTKIPPTYSPPATVVPPTDAPIVETIVPTTPPQLPTQPPAPPATTAPTNVQATSVPPTSTPSTRKPTKAVP